MTGSHSPRRRRVAVFGMALAGALLTGTAVLGWLGRPAANPPDRAADAAAGGSPPGPPGSGPGAATDRAAGGVAHDQVGAVQAAVAYTAAWRQWWLALSDEQLAEALAQVAAPATVEALAAQVAEETRTTRELLAASEGTGSWVDPLAWRVEAYNDTQARVAVWTMRTLAAPALAAPQSEWATVTVDLAWAGGDWRLAAVTTRMGPTPMTGPPDEPWDTAQFVAGLEGFAPLSQATSATASTPSPRTVAAWRDASPPAGDFEHNETGAVNAALAYTAASQRWLYLGEREVAEAVEHIATPQVADSLAAEVVEETTSAREQLARSEGPVWWWVDPLAWRVETYSDTQARVGVWTVTVLSAEGVAVPQADWMTVTVDLEWAQGDWRVAAIRDRPGPTPIASPRDDPWDAVPFADTLAGFTRLGEDPAP